MLEMLRSEANITYTENGAKTFLSSESYCLDLFYTAGAMRNADEAAVCRLVDRAFAEDPHKTMKIIFFARDVRGGLGERRFFRIAIKHLASCAPDAVERNIPNFAEYGRYDDLCALLFTPLEASAVGYIKERLDADTVAMKKGEPASLLAKWLPSVNASSFETVRAARRLCKRLSMSEREYRKALSALRRYTDIIENRLRERDYTFDYSVQTSKALFKYRKAFLRNDIKRYSDFLDKAMKGEAKLNTTSVYPYEIVRTILSGGYDNDEIAALDVTWNRLSAHGRGEENSRAIAIVDGSGSMYREGTLRPIDAALSLGMYFAEQNTGAFGGHFITFSNHPQLVKIQGDNIRQKTLFCSSFCEVANTDLEAVFELILSTAVKNGLAQAELPQRLYIISDMEFDYCVDGGNSNSLFRTMKKKYEEKGYILPDVIFWNVASCHRNVPVTLSDTGAALVSGAIPAIFDMVKSGDLSPVKIMEDIINSERYRPVAA